MAKMIKRQLSIAIAAGLMVAATPAFVPVDLAPVAVAEGATTITDSHTINYSAKGSITISNPREDVTYQLYKVMDITNKADYDEAVAIRVTDDKVTEILNSEDSTPITAEDSGTEWKNLTVGLYVVKTTGNGAQDFLVYVPTTESKTEEGVTTTSWVYDVEATVKDKPTDTAKKVTDSKGLAEGENGVNADELRADVGDKTYYTITGFVPGEYLAEYRIEDTLDTDNLDVSTVTATVKYGEGDLTSGQDYELSTDTETGKVTVKFLKDGLAKLNADPETGQSKGAVTVTLGAKVKSIGDTDGKVDNIAHVIWSLDENKGEDPDNPTPGPEVDNPSNPKGPEDEDNPNQPTPVTQKWVKIRALKTNDKDANDEEAAALGGAEFKLYECTPSNTPGAAAELNKAITLNGADTTATDTWVTDDNGQLVIDGVNVAHGKVCLVETKAPDGYELAPDPIMVDLSAVSYVSATDKDALGNNTWTNPDGSDTSGTATVNYKTTADAGVIKNVPSKTPTLPLTGGKGVALFAVLAALVAGASVYTARRRSTRG